MAVWRCRRCRYEQDEEWLETCPGCHGFYRGLKIGADSVDQKQRSTLAAAAKSTTVYVPTGIEGFDKVIGGGLAPGSAILLGGFRGAGKSTLLTMIADAVANLKGSSLLASSEESVDAVLRTSHRLGIFNEKVEVLGGQSYIEPVLDRARTMRTFLTALDSMQKYISIKSGGAPGSLAQENAVSSAVREYCDETKRCVILLNQMSKSGEMKGGTDAAHAVDIVLVLAFPRDSDEEAPGGEADGIRMLVCDGKNRFGSENNKSYWRMTEAGLFENVPARSRLVEPRRAKYGR